MEANWPSESERRELRSLAERIRRGDCVLVLGPRVAIRPEDPLRRPLDELLAEAILADKPNLLDNGVQDLRQVCERHARQFRDREDLELAVRDFYARESATTTGFHRDLAHLPFKLCICASPDDLMYRAFVEARKTPQRGHYSFRDEPVARLGTPTINRPLIYHLFGHHEDTPSMVLTEGDLIDFVVSIVRGDPPLPDQVRSLVADRCASFLFLGFGFHNWYLRVLLKVMQMYEHRNKALAFEDLAFFDHPDHLRVVGFFTDERMIDFKPLRWEQFARHLREVFDVQSAACKLGPAAPDVPPAGAPKAFLSYASEDRESVETLADDLQRRGIRIWRDAQDLRAGDDWNQVLHDVIEQQVDHVVVVQTPTMLGRERGVFHEEITAALRVQGQLGEFEGQRFRFVMPVRLGGCRDLSSLKNLHAIDIDAPGGVDKLAASILEDWERRQRSRPAAA